jgi:ribonuclease T1
LKRTVAVFRLFARIEQQYFKPGLTTGWIAALFLSLLLCAANATAAVRSIATAALPPQARRVLVQIAQGGPWISPKDGIVFGNYERQLPRRPRGYYREYTVPTPGLRHRGARRIVCGGPVRHPDICYYTDDHYATFTAISR